MKSFLGQYSAFIEFNPSKKLSNLQILQIMGLVQLYSQKILNELRKLLGNWMQECCILMILCSLRLTFQVEAQKTLDTAVSAISPECLISVMENL